MAVELPEGAKADDHYCPTCGRRFEEEPVYCDGPDNEPTQVHKPARTVRYGDALNDRAEELSQSKDRDELRAADELREAAAQLEGDAFPQDQPVSESPVP